MAQYELNLRDYWRIIRKKKSIVIFTTLMLGFFSFFFASFQKPTPIYEATARVKVEQTSTVAGLYLQTISWSPWDIISTQMVVIRSFPIMEKVARRLGYLPEGISSEKVRNTNKFLAIVLGLKERIYVGQEEGTNIINITATSTDPKEAQRLANTVAEVYKEENMLEKNRRIINARDFIEGQLKVIGEKLRNAEEAVRSFREENKFVSLDTKTSTVLNRLTAAESDYNRVKTQLESIALMLTQLKRDQALPEKTTQRIFLENPTSTFASLNRRLVDLNLQKAELLTTYTENHPKVLQVKQKIENVIQSMIEELLAQQKVLKRKEQTLKAEVETLEDQYLSIPASALELARLERRVDQYRALYSQLEQKHQEVLIQMAEQVEEVSIVHPALEPSAPINPSKTTATTAIGLVIGLILGVVLAFVAETFDTSVGAIEDIEEILNLPVIGVIPYATSDDIKKQFLRDLPLKLSEEAMDRDANLVVHFAPKSTVAESYRALRTNLQFLVLEKGAKTISVTSSSSQEGKSTVVANLALVLAQMGKKVLLVDSDLRRPIISRLFGLHSRPGLTNVIIGEVGWRDAVRTTSDLITGRMSMEEVMFTPGIDNLSILPSGPIPPNPSEILDSARMTEFISEAKNEYDVVLFDSPPILPATDAAILGTKLDGVLLLYLVGKVGRGALRRAKTQLDNVGVNIFGVVLSGLRAELTRDFHDFKYYYDRRYAYGAGETEMEEKGVSSKVRAVGSSLLKVLKWRGWLGGIILILALVLGLLMWRMVQRREMTPQAKAPAVGTKLQEEKMEAPVQTEKEAEGKKGRRSFTPSPSHPLSPSGGTGEEVPPPPPSASFEQGYREALQQYESGHYRSAILAFRELLTAPQENSLSDNCQYWLGECYYSLREFQQAIVEFRKVFSYKDSNKRDAAQLKIGMSYLELRDKTKAREELNRLIEDYPNSQYIDRARVLLKGL